MRGAATHRVLLKCAVEDCEGEYARMKGMPIEWVRAPTTQPWDHRASYGRDPEGNVLHVHTIVKEPRPCARGRGALTRRSPHDGRSRRTGVAAAALQGGCAMGKRTLIQVIYPLLQLYWFLVRPKTFGVQCVIRQGDAILLVRNTYGRKQWTFPGGSIARGESAEAAIRREVREEVSLPLQQLQHLGAFDTTINYKRDHVEVFAGVAPDRQVTLDPAEILEARWFQPQDLPPLAPAAARIVGMWHRAKE